MPEINVKINVDSDNSEEDIKRLKQAFNLLGDTAKSSGNNIRSSFSKAMNGVKRFFDYIRGGIGIIRNMFKGLLSTIGNFIGIASFEELVRSIQHVSANFISVNNALKTVTGNSDNAEQSMNFLKGTAQKLGTDLGVLSQAYLKFTAAGVKSRLTSEELHDVFSAMAETSVILQFSTQQMEGAFRALTQMMSKGKVQAEELRGQLGEHLPGAFEIAADSMNLTTKELDEMLKQGLITADYLLGNFAEGLRKAYGEALPGAIRTSTAEFGKLKNEILIFFEENKGTFDKMFGDVARALTKAFNQIKNAGWLDWLVESENGLKVVTDYLENLPMHIATIYTTAKYGLQIYWLEAKKLFLEIKAILPGETGDAAKRALAGETKTTRVRTTQQSFDLEGGSQAGETQLVDVITKTGMSMTEQIDAARKTLEVALENMKLAFSGDAKSYIGSKGPDVETGASERELTRLEKRFKNYSASFGKINKSFEDGKTSVWEYNEALSELQVEFSDLNEKGTEFYEGMKAGARGFASEAGGLMAEYTELTKSAFQGLTDSIVEVLATGKETFRDFAESILRDLLRIYIRASIVLPLAEQLGFGSGSSPTQSALSGLVSSSTNDFGTVTVGKVTDAPLAEAIPLASGGIVTKPTLAMVAEGGSAEAVIPLNQLGNMGGSPTVIINNNSSAEVSQTTVAGPDGESMIQVMIEDKLSKMVQSGKFDKVLTPYNVSRRGYR